MHLLVTFLKLCDSSTTEIVWYLASKSMAISHMLLVSDANAFHDPMNPLFNIISNLSIGGK